MHPKKSVFLSKSAKSSKDLSLFKNGIIATIYMFHEEKLFVVIDSTLDVLSNQRKKLIASTHMPHSNIMRIEKKGNLTHS